MEANAAPASGTDLLTTKEAAAYLGITLGTLHHYLYVKRSLQPDARCGARLLFLTDSLDAYLARKGPTGRPSRPASFDETMLTLKEAAQAWGLEERALEQLLRRGLLTVDGKVSGVRFFFVETVEAVMPIFRRVATCESAS
jgi:hypothetical protein